MAKGLLDMNPLYNRETVIEAIGEAIIEAMKNGDGRIRCYGAKCIGAIRAKKAVRPLIEYLSDEDPDVRCDAAAALGMIGDPEAVPSLIQALNDSDGPVRICVIQALAALGDPSAAGPLIHAMSSTDNFIYSMGEISGDYQWEIRERAAEALGRIGNTMSVQGLMDILKDEDVDLMIDTVFRSIIQSGDSRGLDTISTYLKDHDPKVRRKAARALIHTRDKGILDLLAESLIDKDSVVKVNIIEAIGNIGGEKEIIPLVFLLKDEDRDVRIKAAETICKISRERSRRFIFPLLQDPAPDVRRKAVELLAEAGNVESVVALIPLLEDKGPGVCGEAILALGKIGNDRAVPSLLSILNDQQKRADLRCKSLFSLGKMGFLDGLDAMLERLLDRKEDETLRRTALQVLPMFGQEPLLQRMNVLLNEGDDLVRKGFAKILRDFRDPESEEILLCLLLHDEIEEVKREAALSLAYRGKDAGIDILASWMTPFLSASEGVAPCVEAVCDALREIRNDKAINLLLKGITSNNPAFRCFAARAIGLTGNRSLVGPIADLLTDEDKDVRREAVIALGKLGDRMILAPLIASLYDHERFHDLRIEIACACKMIDLEMTTELMLDTLMNMEKKDDHWLMIETLSAMYSVS